MTGPAAALTAVNDSSECEHSPFWLVFVNKVALEPERPLPFPYVMAVFEQAYRDHPGQEIGVAPCTPDDLANAGITPRKEPT